MFDKLFDKMPNSKMPLTNKRYDEKEVYEAVKEAGKKYKYDCGIYKKKTGEGEDRFEIVATSVDDAKKQVKKKIKDTYGVEADKYGVDVDTATKEPVYAKESVKKMGGVGEANILNEPPADDYALDDNIIDELSKMDSFTLESALEIARKQFEKLGEDPRDFNEDFLHLVLEDLVKQKQLKADYKTNKYTWLDAFANETREAPLGPYQIKVGQTYFVKGEPVKETRVEKIAIRKNKSSLKETTATVHFEMDGEDYIADVEVNIAPEEPRTWDYPGAPSYIETGEVIKVIKNDETGAEVPVTDEMEDIIGRTVDWDDINEASINEEKAPVYDGDVDDDEALLKYMEDNIGSQR